jgi:thiazole synthase
MDKFIIGSREVKSRLLVGTGKYKDFNQTAEAIQMSGAEIVTVAIRRTNIGQNEQEPSLLDFISPEECRRSCENPSFSKRIVGWT